ncbi:hypothetical protein B0J14DRAFT_640666 [Halenospora varia]|nr:hypothetical protein B0J14DRAFT_640666 [Halenospora varia]
MDSSKEKTLIPLYKERPPTQHQERSQDVHNRTDPDWVDVALTFFLNGPISLGFILYNQLGGSSKQTAFFTSRVIFLYEAPLVAICTFAMLYRLVSRERATKQEENWDEDTLLDEETIALLLLRRNENQERNRICGITPYDGMRSVWCMIWGLFWFTIWLCIRTTVFSE